MIVAPTRRWIIGLILLVPVLSMGSTGIRASGQLSASQDAVWQFTAERPAGALPRADLIGAPAHARFSKTAGVVPAPTPTPTPTPTPSPTPTPTPGTCVGNPPVAGWVCTASGGWVPPNHPLAGGGRPD